MERSDRIATGAALFAGVSALFSALTWYYAAKADDNMIEQEIYRRQLAFCETIFRKEEIFSRRLIAFIESTRRISEPLTEEEAQGFMDDYNSLVDNKIYVFAELFVGKMYLPEKINLSAFNWVQTGSEFLAAMKEFEISDEEYEILNAKYSKAKIEFAADCEKYVEKRTLIVIGND